MQNSCREARRALKWSIRDDRKTRTPQTETPALVLKVSRADWHLHASQSTFALEFATCLKRGSFRTKRKLKESRVVADRQFFLVAFGRQGSRTGEEDS